MYIPKRIHPPKGQIHLDMIPKFNIYETVVVLKTKLNTVQRTDTPYSSQSLVLNSKVINEPLYIP